MLYSQVKPILARVQDAEQLRRIEENSPQIQGEDAELWKKLIARDVPTWEKKGYVPKNAHNWYKVYKRYVREQKEEIIRDQEKLRETMMGIQSKREQHTSQLVNLKSVVVPRDPRMRIGDGARRRTGGNQKDMSTLNFSAGSKTKMKDGKSVLNRARKEAKEIHAMGRLNKLTHTLAGSASQVKKAPEGMRREYEIAAQPAVSKVLMSKRKNMLGGASRVHPSLGADLDEREARLRKAMQPSGAKKVSDEESRGTKRTVVDFSDDEDEAHDDLFDEPPPKKAKAAPSSSSIATSSNSNSPARSKPSDMISKMLAMKKTNSPQSQSRPRPPVEARLTTNASKSQVPAVSSPVPSPAPHQIQSDSSSASATKRPPPPPSMVIPRKKKEVDVFNRKAMRRPPQR